MPTSKSSSNPRRISIGITLGDPSGIGPEVVAKALDRLPVQRSIQYKIIGDKKIFSRYAKKLAAAHEWVDIDEGPAPWIIGKKNLKSAEASYNYLKKAVGLITKKEISALVTAPVCKETIMEIDPAFIGHTEFLAQKFRAKQVEMMFVAHQLRVVIATRHLPLVEVSRAISQEKILRTITLVHNALKCHFGIKDPLIAVCGLNPHAGEGGTMGKEDLTKILPAIQEAKRKHIRVEGPLSADTLFFPDHVKKYAAVIAMYHDQGLIPVKTLYFKSCVNLTLGLPFIRTSPAHGTAFNIAGKNLADPTSMFEAIKLAVTLSQKG